ncbi:hypothetical protein ASE70_08500 [Sphingomonas sp. Leaf22]|uniref:hypothetical protein n=1 Tax=Sphingomonas sp. Leaf22 TaxID=1735687 RepID=UPI0006F9DA55|nr:hypothetical protein [Sphingomonas sp. Leaf22]KQM76792.1 hypothetical protein ASE70_08500 [Sphingomonas sp. Leaf22]
MVVGVGVVNWPDFVNWLTIASTLATGVWLVVRPEQAVDRTLKQLQRIGAEPAQPGIKTRITYQLLGGLALAQTAILLFKTYSE